MYKIFKVIYNDGGWHSGDLPHFFYIAKSKEEVIANSEKYKDYLERKECFGGDIWVGEVSSSHLNYDFENLKDFNIIIAAKNKDE